MEIVLLKTFGTIYSRVCWYCLELGMLAASALDQVLYLCGLCSGGLPQLSQHTLQGLLSGAGWRLPDQVD